MYAVSAHRATTGGHDEKVACSLRRLSARAVGARMRHQNGNEPHKRPAPSTRTSLHSQRTGGCSAAEAGQLTSLTTTDRLGKHQSADETIDSLCERRTPQPARVSSPRWAVGGGRARKFTRCTQELGLKYAARVFDVAGSGPHRTHLHLARVRGGNPRSFTLLRHERAHASRHTINIVLPRQRVPDVGESRKTSFS